MKKHYCQVEKTEIEFEGQCNWCDEKEWQGLSDDEIEEVIGESISDMYSGHYREYRAIEAKLKEKNT